MKLNHLLSDFITKLENAKNLSDCFKALEQSIELLGFSGVIYSSIPIGLNALSNDDLVFLRSAHFSAAFLDHYTEANFSADDFTIKRIQNSNLNIADWWAEEQKGLLLPEERHVIEVARTDYKITNGISIPMSSTPHHIAGASVISGESKAFFAKLLAENLPTLQTLITLFHHRVQGNTEFKKTFYLPVLSKLNTREKQILKFTLSGKAYKTLDNSYGLSASAAANIRTELFKKFGVSNVSELVYLAGLHNLTAML